MAPKELNLTLLTVAPNCSAHPQDDYTPIGSLLLADTSVTVTSCPARLLLRIAAASCQLVQHDPVEEVVVRASRGDTPQIVFSFTHYSPLAPSYPHHAMDISLSLSPLHGTARLAFILRLLHSVTEGTLLSSFQSDEPVADPTPTDYSTGARLSLFFSSVSVHLPCDEGFRSSCELRADRLSLVTGDRSALFNTLVVRATPLHLLDRRAPQTSAVIVATPEAELKIHTSAALTRLSLSLGDSAVVLQPHTVERVLQAEQHLLANRTQSESTEAIEPAEELLTEVSDSDSEDSVEAAAARATFCFEAAVSSLRCTISQPCLSPALSVATYLDEISGHSSLTLIADAPFFSIKSSPSDRLFGRLGIGGSPRRGPHTSLFARGHFPLRLLPPGRRRLLRAGGPLRAAGHGLERPRVGGTGKQPRRLLAVPLHSSLSSSPAPAPFFFISIFISFSTISASLLLFLFLSPPLLTLRHQDLCRSLHSPHSPRSLQGCRLPRLFLHSLRGTLRRLPFPLQPRRLLM